MNSRATSDPSPDAVIDAWANFQSAPVKRVMPHGFAAPMDSGGSDFEAWAHEVVEGAMDAFFGIAHADLKLAEVAGALRAPNFEEEHRAKLDARIVRIRRRAAEMRRTKGQFSALLRRAYIKGLTTVELGSNYLVMAFVIADFKALLKRDYCPLYLRPKQPLLPEGTGETPGIRLGEGN